MPMPPAATTTVFARTRKGAPPIEIEADGPEIIHVELRLILPPKTTDEGEFVSEVLLDGGVVDWEDFKAVPQADISYGDFAVCDKDTVKVAIPEGRHRLQFRLLTGTSDQVLVRFRRAQTEEIADEKADKI